MKFHYLLFYSTRVSIVVDPLTGQSTNNHIPAHSKPITQIDKVLEKETKVKPDSPKKKRRRLLKSEAQVIAENEVHKHSTVWYNSSHSLSNEASSIKQKHTLDPSIFMLYVNIHNVVMFIYCFLL